MSIDLDAIRQWLAALCDENERLRAGCPLGDDPLDGANCHLCGGTADTFWVSDDLWQRVGLSGQVCFRCFRVAAWYVEIRPESNWFVSLSDVESERDQALADSKVFEQSMWGLVAERDAWREDAARLAAEILRFDGRAIPDSAWEALAAHDALKGGEQ